MKVALLRTWVYSNMCCAKDVEHILQQCSHICSAVTSAVVLEYEDLYKRIHLPIVYSIDTHIFWELQMH